MWKIRGFADFGDPGAAVLFAFATGLLLLFCGILPDGRRAGLEWQT